MKILITGAGGMLGQTLSSHLKNGGHDVKEFSKDKLDITNFAQVNEILCSEGSLDLVIHCAAYTKVDQAEAEPALAYLVNGYGTENVAIICNKLHVPMLYFSTDYVFDGEKKSPYTTWDQTNPLSIYGKSKLAGEMAVQRHLNNFYILRTSWLYGPFGKNFVDTILAAAEEKKPLKVVADQIGSPTYTVSLAQLVLELIKTQRFGIYHATDEGFTTWFDFACEITKHLGVTITPINTSEMPRPAARPKYSGLDKANLITAIGRKPPMWQESLHAYLQLRRAKEPASRS